MTIQTEGPDAHMSVQTLEPVQIRHTPLCPFKVKKGTKQVCGLCGKSRFLPVHHSPSLNQFGKNKSGFVYNDAKREWQKVWIALLFGAGLPTGLSRVYVEGRMSFGDNIQRDQGNFRYFLEKALGDALQQGGWLAGDHWGVFEFGQLSREDTPGEKWTELLVMPRA